VALKLHTVRIEVRDISVPFNVIATFRLSRADKVSDSVARTIVFPGTRNTLNIAAVYRKGPEKITRHSCLNA
jgi:hypothetical protein